MSKYYQGRFRPKNPTKYMGDPTKIIYRSSWELSLMRYLDKHQNVLEWASEEVIIPYVSPIDGKVHRYFPDFLIKMEKNDKVETVLVEVKPKSQTKPPNKSSMKKKNGARNPQYIKEVKTWCINEAKWKAAQEFCKDRKWKFKVMTEDQLGA